MGVSKVVIDGEVKLDLTADTVEPAALKAGYTAHNAAGDKIVGTMPAISLEDVYPVGAIYMSAAATNPGTLFGFGTWEQIKDVFLLAAGDTYAAGATGGEATHILSEAELPTHAHKIYYGNNSGTYYTAEIGFPAVMESNGTPITKSWGAEMCKTANTGSWQAHNNMPPYLAVYAWRRTA